MSYMAEDGDEWEVSFMTLGTPVVFKGIVHISMFPSDRSLSSADTLSVDIA
jgi:hypothetical protein